MSDASKIDRLKKVTTLFDEFVDHIGSVRKNMDRQSDYSEGYADCLSDILKSIKENKDSEVINIIKDKLYMEAKKEVLDELEEGLMNLNNAYTNILNEE